MSELWLFEILTSEAEVEVEAEVKTKSRSTTKVKTKSKIYYHAKFQSPSLKNEWVMAIWNNDTDILNYMESNSKSDSSLLCL